GPKRARRTRWSSSSKKGRGGCTCRCPEAPWSSRERRTSASERVNEWANDGKSLGRGTLAPELAAMGGRGPAAAAPRAGRDGGGCALVDQRARARPRVAPRPRGQEAQQGQGEACGQGSPQPPGPAR